MVRKYPVTKRGPLTGAVRWLSAGSAVSRYVASALVGFIVLAAPARAQTIFLQCSQAPLSMGLTIDLSRSTVNNLPATINETSIDWARTYSPIGAVDSTTDTETNHIDRTTGTYTKNDTVHWANGNVSQMTPSVLSCTKASVPSTKF